VVLIEWIKKMQYMQIMEYYSTLKKRPYFFSVSWVNLEDVMLSEISQSQKDKCSPYMWHLKQSNS